MSEKILGFKEDEADVGQHPNGKDVAYLIAKKKLVSVRLASESVDLKALKARLNELSFDAGTKGLHQDYLVALQNIEDWAEKEAKKK